MIDAPSGVDVQGGCFLAFAFGVRRSAFGVGRFLI